MAVTDSPDTRIKARDAKPLLELHPGLETFNHLHRLLNAHGMKAVAAITLRGGEDAARHTVAHNTADRDVLHEFISGVVEHNLPAEVRALRGAVIYAVRDDGAVDIATWGSDRKACAAVAKWSGGVVLPAAPFQTWFGWGNGGRPLAFTVAELESLNPQQRAYVERNTHRRASR